MPSRLPPRPFPPLPDVRHPELGAGSIGAARLNRNHAALLGSSGLEAMGGGGGGRKDWAEAGGGGKDLGGARVWSDDRPHEIDETSFLPPLNASFMRVPMPWLRCPNVSPP
jgi:hypothetical protein